jgi:hypothetical protein
VVVDPPVRASEVVVPGPALTWLTIPTLLDAPTESWAYTENVYKVVGWRTPLQVTLVTVADPEEQEAPALGLTDQ